MRHIVIQAHHDKSEHVVPMRADDCCTQHVERFQRELADAGHQTGVSFYVENTPE